LFCFLFKRFLVCLQAFVVACSVKLLDIYCFVFSVPCFVVDQNDINQICNEIGLVFQQLTRENVLFFLFEIFNERTRMIMPRGDLPYIWIK
jgi:hypothetical protein